MSDEGTQAHIDALAAQVKALTAERDMLRGVVTRYEGTVIHQERRNALARLDAAEAERDAARAELAAANIRISEFEHHGYNSFPHVENGQLRAENQRMKVRCEETEAAWWELTEKDAALQATLDRVTAVINTPDGHREWHNQGRSGVCQVVDVSRLRAALTPEGKP